VRTLIVWPETYGKKLMLKFHMQRNFLNIVPSGFIMALFLSIFLGGCMPVGKYTVVRAPVSHEYTPPPRPHLSVYAVPNGWPGYTKIVRLPGSVATLAFPKAVLASYRSAFAAHFKMFEKPKKADYTAIADFSRMELNTTVMLDGSGQNADVTLRFRNNIPIIMNFDHSIVMRVPVEVEIRRAVIYRDARTLAVQIARLFGDELLPALEAEILLKVRQLDDGDMFVIPQ